MDATPAKKGGSPGSPDGTPRGMWRFKQNTGILRFAQNDGRKGAVAGGMPVTAGFAMTRA